MTLSPDCGLLGIACLKLDCCCDPHHVPGHHRSQKREALAETELVSAKWLQIRPSAELASADVVCAMRKTPVVLQREMQRLILHLPTEGRS